MENTYERVRFNDTNDRYRAKTVYLRNVQDTGATIGGTEVNREGDDVQPRGHDSRYRIISKTLITKRTEMKMSPFYAELEERPEV